MSGVLAIGVMRLMIGHDTPRFTSGIASSVRQQDGTWTGLGARDDGHEHIPAARLLPFAEFLHETDAVTDGNQNHFHAGIGGDRVIEGTDRGDVLVAREIAGHVAALEHVVQEDQASRSQS